MLRHCERSLKFQCSVLAVYNEKTKCAFLAIIQYKKKYIKTIGIAPVNGDRKSTLQRGLGLLRPKHILRILKIRIHEIKIHNAKFKYL
jgi:hypothetical protein